MTVIQRRLSAVAIVVGGGVLATLGFLIPTSVADTPTGHMCAIRYAASRGWYVLYVSC